MSSLVEIVSEFDYQSLPEKSRIVVQQKWSEIESLLRVRTQNAIEIGYRLLDIKKELGHGHWRKFTESLPFSRATADRWVALAESHSQMPQIESFGLSAAYELSGADEPTIAAIPPATPHKEVKKALEFQPGTEYVVNEPSSQYHGQKVEVKKRDGDVVYCDTPDGETQPMLFGWLAKEAQPTPEAKPTPAPKQTISELLESTNLALDIARERSLKLQQWGEKVCQRYELDADLQQEAIALGLVG